MRKLWSWSYGFSGSPVPTDLRSGVKIPFSKTVWPYFVWIALVLLETAATVKLNEGTFTYSLDDAYIHLALGRQISQGHYGINAGEFSAPSSSILWPLLLSPFASLTGYALVPFLINLAAAVLILLVCGRFFSRLFRADVHRPWGPILTLLMIPAFNLIGLVFTGMEHTLQLLLALLIAEGLVRGQEGDPPGWGFYAALVLGPLIRYENTVLSLIGLFWLFQHHQRTAAWTLSLIVAGLMAGFSLFLHAHALGWLPASIHAKSITLFGGHSSLWSNVLTNLGQRQALVLLLSLIPLLAAMITRPSSRLLTALSVCAVVAHLLLGRFGWADRYEIYILGFVLFILAYLYGPTVMKKPLWIPGGVYVILVLPFALNWLYTPLGCNNIYQQQQQMARFSRDYVQAPVAVNDLGCVAFHADHYVLDVWGLASPEALTLKRRQSSAVWMDSLAQRHGVKLAMIYDHYYPLLPKQWVCIGKLFLGRRKVTTDQTVVSFYAVKPEIAAQLHAQLRLFSATLPSGVVLETKQYTP